MHPTTRTHQTESKFQCWRALAVFEDGGERLLFVGRSAPHVQAGYAHAFSDLLDESERAGVRRISLQLWEGAADQGRWVARTKLNLPAGATA